MNNNNIDYKLLELQARIQLARKNFFWYCNLVAKDFYKEDRKYLVDMCNTFQRFYENDDKVMVINCPPRHGKSRTATLFVQWLLGQNKYNRIMTGSYNEGMSTTFSKGVRDIIQVEKDYIYNVVYNDIFPDVHINRGDAQACKWKLEGCQETSYLATSPNGSSTGVGCDYLIIDDVIKNAEEANNSNVKDKHWDWFTNTLLSRVEHGCKIIIIMTRWASDDLAGRILEWCKQQNIKHSHINYDVIQDENNKIMLCEEIFSWDDMMFKKSVMGANIFNANYRQTPIDLEGRLYKSFKTYDIIPSKGKVLAYIDTADKGEDYLCCIVYTVHNKEAYILDVLYTQEPMEITENEVAKMLINNGVNECKIEGNNGGEGFARAVRNKMLNKYNSNKCVIKTFHQSKNKEARILSNSSWICEHMYFPSNWNNKWRDYYEAMYSYQAQGKNKHDDAPDATTGVCEQIVCGVELPTQIYYNVNFNR